MIDSKENLDQPVTLRDFKDFAGSIGDTITKAVRQEVSDTITKVVRQEVGYQLEPLREEMRQWKDDILTSNDKVITEIKDLRIEVTSFHGGQMRQDETLADHEHRIRDVEDKMPA